MDFFIAAFVAVAFAAIFVVLPAVFLRFYKPFSSSGRAFVFGIGCTLIFVGVLWSWLSFGIGGGQIEESPNGAWSISVTGPLSPTTGGTYSIEIFDNHKNETIRKLRVQLDRNEKTIPLRGADRIVTWSPKNKYADVALGEVVSIRVYVP